MNARILDGKAEAANIRQMLQVGVMSLQNAMGTTPRLDVIQVGGEAASSVYVKSKKAAAESVGMRGLVHNLSETTIEEDVIQLLEKLNSDPDVDGILVQLPLPKGWDSTRICQLVSCAKDVDGFHVQNTGQLFIGKPAFVPCTPQGCMWLLNKDAKQTGQPLAGKHAVVVGRSQIVGLPVAHLLLQADCTVTIAHSKTVDLPSITRQADILVAAVGRPEFIKGDWVKSGAVVIDVGINRINSDSKSNTQKTTQNSPERTLVGDVAFDEVALVASAITPVPRGVGPLTIAFLLANTLRAYIRRRKYDTSFLSLELQSLLGL